MSGSALVGGSAVIGGPLYLAGVNVADAIASAGSTFDSSSTLYVASIKAGSAVPSEAGASAFVDLEAQNLRVSRVRAPANTALVLEGATVGEAVSIDASGLVTISTQANLSHSLTVKVGRGGTLTGGAMLRIVSDAGTQHAANPVLGSRRRRSISV